MLTPNDARSDGDKISYLRSPGEWRQFDPELFAQLRPMVSGRKVRSVRAVEAAGILSNTVFYSKTVPDDAIGRSAFFDAFKESCRDCSLVFLDPDNGFEVKSVPYGRKNSSKYVYWNELDSLYKCGKSLLVYQHFPRVKRQSFARSLVSLMKRRLQPSRTFSFATSNVLFVLAAQQCHLSYIQVAVNEVRLQWGEKLLITEK